MGFLNFYRRKPLFKIFKKTIHGFCRLGMGRHGFEEFHASRYYMSSSLLCIRDISRMTDTSTNNLSIGTRLNETYSNIGKTRQGIRSNIFQTAHKNRYIFSSSVSCQHALGFIEKARTINRNASPTQLINHF